MVEEKEVKKMAVCTCGREIKYSPHCPMCGSSYIYARDASSRIVNSANGERFVARGFRCRKCSINFCEMDPCMAPPILQVSESTIRKATTKRLESTESTNSIMKTARSVLGLGRQLKPAEEIDPNELDNLDLEP